MEIKKIESRVEYEISLTEDEALDLDLELDKLYTESGRDFKPTVLEFWNMLPTHPDK